MSQRTNGTVPLKRTLRYSLSVHCQVSTNAEVGGAKILRREACNRFLSSFRMACGPRTRHAHGFQLQLPVRKGLAGGIVMKEILQAPSPTAPRQALLVRWQRAGFRRYWRWKSRSPGGRPQVDADLRCHRYTPIAGASATSPLRRARLGKTASPKG